MASSRRAREDGAPEVMEEHGRHGRPLAITLAVGFALLAIALLATLSSADQRSTGTDGTQVADVLATTETGGTLCQSRELIPAGTGAAGLSLKLASGGSPFVKVEVQRGRETLARGTRTARWSGQQATVPLRPVLKRDVLGRVCITLGTHATIAIGGAVTGSRVAAKTGSEPLTGRLRIDYLRPTHESWRAFASTLDERMGIGRASAGLSPMLLAALLLLAAVALGSWQLVRRSP